MARRRTPQHFSHSVQLQSASSQDINFGDVLDFAKTDSFTLATWAKITDVHGTHTPLWDKLSSFGTYRLGLNSDGKLYLQIRESDNTIHTVTADEFHNPEGKWTHFSATYNNTDIKLYINGKVVGSGTFTGADIGATGHALQLGHATNNAIWADAYFSDSKIWSRALSEDEMADLYYDGVYSETDLELEVLFTDGDGTTVTDSSGNGRNGTITGSATWSTSVPSKQMRTTQDFTHSLRFDGSGHYVDFGDADDFSLTGDFSLGVWIKPSDPQAGATTQGIMAKRTNSTNVEFLLYYARTNKTLHFAVYDSGGSPTFVLASSADRITDNQWSQLTVTRSGNDFKMYLNGAVIDTGSSTKVISNTASNLYLGIQGGDLTGNVWRGLMSTAFILKGTALSDDQVAEYCRVGEVGGVELTEEWKFQDGTGTTLTGENGNNGTITSADWQTDVPSKTRSNISQARGSSRNFKHSLQMRGELGNTYESDHGNDSSLVLDGDFTVSTWVKGNDLAFAKTFPGILGKRTNGTTREFQLLYANSSKKLSFTRSNAAGTSSSLDTTADALTDGQWHNVVCTYDDAGETKKIYIDGALNASAAGDALVISDTGASFHIGKIGDDGQSWNGFIGETIVIKGHDWTAGEVRDYHNSGQIPTSGTKVLHVLSGDESTDGAGATLTDSSASANDGTITDALWSLDVPSKPRRSPSSLCNSLSFDGSSDKAEVTEGNLRVAGDVSFGLWVKTDDITQSANAGLIGIGEAGETEAENILYYLMLTTGSAIQYFHEYGPSGNNQTTTFSYTLQPHVWTHVVCTRDLSEKEVKLYINGALVDDYTYTNDPTGGTSGDFRIGESNSAAGLGGKLTGAFVTTDVLTADQVAQIYRNELPPSDLANIVEYWDFADGTGSTLGGSSDSGAIDLTITGAAWSQDVPN